MSGAPPLALDLHYIITAYGRADFQAEILLGYAMHLLHERPMLDREAIRRALDPSPLDVSMLPPTFQVLAASDLAAFANETPSRLPDPMVWSPRNLDKLISSPKDASEAMNSPAIITALAPFSGPLE